MPTQRPYFANFLAAFRVTQAIKSSPAASTTATTTSGFSQSANFSATTTKPQQQDSQPQQVSPPPQPTNTRPIPSKTPAGFTGTSVAFSPTAATHHTRHTAGVPGPRSPASPLSAGAGGTFPGRTRRGSDSSSEGGFRDALGGEKWFIGGRTAQGEERFYNLTMARRDRSGERASVDRMSL